MFKNIWNLHQGVQFNFSWNYRIHWYSVNCFSQIGVGWPHPWHHQIKSIFIPDLIIFLKNTPLFSFPFHLYPVKYTIKSITYLLIFSMQHFLLWDHFEFSLPLLEVFFLKNNGHELIPKCQVLKICSSFDFLALDF